MIDPDLLLSYGATYRKVALGEVIFSEGQVCSYYYQVRSGQVRWANLDEQGKECIHFLAEEGESFGEFPLFDDQPYAASAIADSDSVLIRLAKPSFLELLKAHPDILFKFTAMFTRRFRFKYSLLKSFGSNCPETRIKYLLNYLKSERKSFCNDCDKLKLTRQQIADMTGLRVETVIRSIKSLEKKGELMIVNRKVYR